MIEYLVIAVTALFLSAGFTWPLYRDFADTREKMKDLDAIKANVSEALEEVRQSVHSFNECIDERDDIKCYVEELQAKLDAFHANKDEVLNRCNQIKAQMDKMPSLEDIAVGVGNFDVMQAKAFDEMKNRLDAVCQMALEMNGLLTGILDRLFYLELSYGMAGRNGSLVEALFSNRNPATNLERKYSGILNGKEEDGDGE